MPTVLKPDCSACLRAHGCNSLSSGDRYGAVRSCSAACRCGSPVPPNQTSSFGLAFSAASCAIDSPEPLSVSATLMPVSRWNSVATRLHHSPCTEQMTLSCCAAATEAPPTRARAHAHRASRKRCDDIGCPCCRPSGRWRDLRPSAGGASTGVERASRVSARVPGQERERRLVERRHVLVKRGVRAFLEHVQLGMHDAGHEAI